MPGFNFAKGNAKKLLGIPLYALGAAASLLVPRSMNRWVFGCGSGIGEGALALYRYTRSADPDAQLVWMARDETDRRNALALGIPAIRRTSLAGFTCTLRSAVVIVTHGFGDVNRYATRGSFIVQLWHGVPLKLIQLDSAATTRISIPIFSRQVRNALRGFYRRGYRRAISLMPAASALVADRLQTAFGIASRVIAVTGDPRDDVLSLGTKSDRRSEARSILFAALRLPDDQQRVLMFAPTWRDGQPDPGLPSVEEWTLIDEWLHEHDSMLVVRPHPLGVGDYSAGCLASGRIHLLSSEQLSDLTPILTGVDLLVTDYSSVAFDYCLTGGPIFFIAPDQDTYAQSRGLYEPYRYFSGGREEQTWSALLAGFSRFDNDSVWAGVILSHSTRLAEKHFEFRDGRNTERLYNEIERRRRHPSAPMKASR